MTEKEALRRDMLSRLRAVAPAERAAWSHEIARRVLALPCVLAARRVMLFSAMATEPDTAPILSALWEAGKQVYLPRVLGGGRMEMAPYPPDCEMRPGPYGILEPTGPACLDAPQLVLAPGVAFDRWGGRLGHGAGYYDRFLAKGGPVAVGLAFEAQLVQRVPAQDHDLRMALVVTQRAVYREGEELSNC